MLWSFRLPPAFDSCFVPDWPDTGIYLISPEPGSAELYYFCKRLAANQWTVLLGQVRLVLRYTKEDQKMNR